MAYPAVVYQRISAVRTSAFGRDATAVEPVIQVDVYGEEGRGMRRLRTCRCGEDGLQRHRGGAILDTFIDAERDDYEENTELFRKSFDIRPWYRET